MDIVKVLNLENELASYRQHLNDLIYENKNNVDTDRILSQKINDMKRQIDRMQQELDIISGNNVGYKSCNVQKKPDIKPYAQKKEPKKDHKKGKNKPDDSFLEKKIGSMVGGIIAAVLIFTGMILLGMVVSPWLSNLAKAICMTTVACVVAGIGAIFMNHDNTNLFYRTICGIGTGSIYISIIAGDIFFHAWGSIVSILMLLIWAATIRAETSCLGEEDGRPDMFNIIGNVGVFLSASFGIIACIVNRDIGGITASASYVLFAYIMINAGSKKIHFSNYMYWFAAADASALLFMDTILHAIEKNTYIVPVTAYIAAFLVAAGYIMERVWNRKDTQLYIHIAASVSAAIIAYSMYISIADGKLRMAAIYAVCLAFIADTESMNEGNNNTFKSSIFLSVIAWSAIFASGSLPAIYNGILQGIGASVLIIIPLIVYGVSKYNTEYSITASILTAAGCVVYDLTGGWQIWGMVGILAITTICFILPKEKMQKQWGFMLPSMILSLAIFTSGSVRDFASHIKNISDTPVNTWEALNGSIPQAAGFLIAGIVFIIATRMWQDSKINGKQQEEKFLLTAVLMTYGLHVLSVNGDSGIIIEEKGILMPALCISLLVLTICMLCALFCMNTNQILKKHPDQIPVAIYIALKYSILIAAVMSACHIPDIGISTALILFSCICIYAGFKKEQKGFRLYGLLLSLIAVFKLLVVDFHTDNPAYSAVMFFICGIIELFISFSYNNMGKAKRLKNEKTNNHNLDANINIHTIERNIENMDEENTKRETGYK